MSSRPAPWAPSMRASDAGAQREKRQRMSEQAGQEERRPPAQERPAEHAQDLERRDGREADAQRRRRRSHLGRGPGSESIGMNALADGLGESPQLFAEVEAVAQLGDRLLALADRVDLGGREQPAREAVLAGRRARGAQELEQRAGSEQIEIDGIGMMLVEEARAGRSDPRPAILDAREAGLVVASRPRGERATLEHAGDGRPPARGTRPAAAPSTRAKRGATGSRARPRAAGRASRRDASTRPRARCAPSAPLRRGADRVGVRTRRPVRRWPIPGWGGAELLSKAGASLREIALLGGGRGPARGRWLRWGKRPKRSMISRWRRAHFNASSVNQAQSGPASVTSVEKRSTERSLEREVLGVLERQVEERALGGGSSPIAAGVDDRDRDGECPSRRVRTPQPCHVGGCARTDPGV